MEELFKARLPGGEQPDIHLCLFPHLKELLVIDLREKPGAISLLSAQEVFTGDFYTAVEAEFSEALRAETEFPFRHLLNLPVLMEEAIRESAMTFILDRLGVNPHSDSIPTVVVFIVSGGALAAQPDLVLDGLKRLLGEHFGEPMLVEWEGALSRLITEESAVLQNLSRNELSETMGGDSPDYFTLWESRN